MYAVEHKTPGNPSPIEWDLIGADHLPHLRVTEHLIGHRPASACPTGNYIASPLPVPGDATTNAMPPPPPLPSPPSPSSSPSSPDRHIPRAYHGVERRQRSRPSSRGRTDYFSKLTRAERAAVKTASSRRVTYAHQSPQIASSSLWTAPNDAPPTSTATAKPKRHRPPIPTFISAGHIADLSLARTSFDYEREESPGFDADIEFEPADVIRRDRRARVGAKERLTIIIPGGKSEAYVAMAFERSCSLAADDDDDNDDSALHRGMSSSSSSLPSFIPPPSTERHLLAPEGVTSREKGNGKTGLKIKIPLPSPLYMLSLRMAGSCRVSSDEAAVAAVREECASGCPGARTGFPGSGYASSTASTSSSALGSCSDNAMMTSQDRHQGNRGSGPLLVRGGASAASRSPALATATALPSRSPSLEGRVARRIARRAALAPYCVIDRLPVARSSQRPYLVPY